LLVAANGIEVRIDCDEGRARDEGENAGMQARGHQAIERGDPFERVVAVTIVRQNHPARERVRQRRGSLAVAVDPAERADLDLFSRVPRADGRRNSVHQLLQP
jgi:hypothetical protein